QSCLPLPFVRTVTRVAVVGQDRSDVAVEVYLRRLLRRGDDGSAADNHHHGEPDEPAQTTRDVEPWAGSAELQVGAFGARHTAPSWSSALRFMGSHHDFDAAHWDREPVATPPPPPSVLPPPHQRGGGGGGGRLAGRRQL